MRAFFFLAFSLMLWSCGDTPTPPSGAINVKDLYTTRGAACHGMDGTMSVGGSKPLNTSLLKEEEIISQIKNGKGAMPPFQGRLSDEEITALSKFILTFRTP